MKSHWRMALPVLVSLLIHAAIATRVRVVDLLPAGPATVPFKISVTDIPASSELAGGWARSSIGQMSNLSAVALEAGTEPAVRPFMAPHRPEPPGERLEWEEVELAIAVEESSDMRGPEGLKDAEELLGPLPLDELTAEDGTDG